jgi:hypothetical protein
VVELVVELGLKHDSGSPPYDPPRRPALRHHTRPVV